MAVKEWCSVKLSPNKKSIFGMIPRSQILYLLLVVGIFSTVSADEEVSCKNVKNYFVRKGIVQLVNIQDQPNSDSSSSKFYKAVRDALDRNRWRQAIRRRCDPDADHDPQI